MRAVIRFAALIWLALASPLMAQNSPVLVEFFTSQGCSSCPPADAYFHKELAQRDDVIALALHVDYWDYIGWKDDFANPVFTRRQKAYAAVAGNRMIYTPQMIVAGHDHVIGTHPDEVQDMVRKHSAMPSPVTLSLVRQGDQVLIRAAAGQPVGKTVVQLVRYRPLKSVAIERGENAGRTVDYANIVESWNRLAEWDGLGVLELRTNAPGDLPVVAIIQQAGPGPVLAAARLK